MLEPGVEIFWNGFVNALVLALWPVLPVLVLGYSRQSIVARRIRPEFSLRKSESIELDRAVLLYSKVCCRLNELRLREERPLGWRVFLYRQPDTFQQDADELEDLEAHAQHLRATIARLRHQPLKRLRSWLHIKSSQFAFGRALAAHVIGFALVLIIAFHVFEQSAWADEFMSGGSNVLIWYPVDERLLYSNAVGAGFAAVAAPAFYLMRRVRLRRQYSLEFHVLKDLANTAPSELIGLTQTEEAAQDPAQQADKNCNWFAILGVSESPTIEEVRKAYKALIRQNHPDRVHDMSPVFRKLAESETKKINAAYRQALESVPSHYRTVGLMR